MSWKVEFTSKARKDLRRISPSDQRRIADSLFDRVGNHPDPRSLAKRLSGVKMALWRFRVGDYRIIVSFEDERMIALVVAIGNRREIYR